MKSPIQYIRQFLSVRLSLWIVLFATIIFLLFAATAVNAFVQANFLAA